MSGRARITGFLTITPGTCDLFRTDYRLPMVPPEIAAPAAAYSEHLFPLLPGLFSRLPAAALPGMTSIIEIFVCPDAWPMHLSWAGLLLIIISSIIGRGAGKLLLDRKPGIR